MILAKDSVAVLDKTMKIVTIILFLFFLSCSNPKETGEVQLFWFMKYNSEQVSHYDVYRFKSMEGKQSQKINKDPIPVKPNMVDIKFIDSNLELDHVYYYSIVSVYKDGKETDLGNVVIKIATKPEE